LLLGPSPIADIAAQCGFADQSHLTRVFKKLVGLAPGLYRRSSRLPPIGGIRKGAGFPQNCRACPATPEDTDGVRDARRQP
jgi:AraC-like DNA-binding protein